MASAATGLGLTPCPPGCGVLRGPGATLPKFHTGCGKVTLLAPPATFRSVVGLHREERGGSRGTLLESHARCCHIKPRSNRAKRKLDVSSEINESDSH